MVITETIARVFFFLGIYFFFFQCYFPLEFVDGNNKSLCWPHTATVIIIIIFYNICIIIK